MVVVVVVVMVMMMMMMFRPAGPIPEGGSRQSNWVGGARITRARLVPTEGGIDRFEMSRRPARDKYRYNHN
ncbi:hypothetical protein ElyMa_001523500 [Elysia marginata]|uniref:Secreted protein n=1 Tax=Elysia marginata TaxID=1093978 RepID=A0AAV4J7X9_9GAST|nr:hypothetical protein ElyMa_001523500 [Elysia marginata]